MILCVFRLLLDIFFFIMNVLYICKSLRRRVSILSSNVFFFIPEKGKKRGIKRINLPSEKNLPIYSRIMLLSGT